MTSTTPPYAGDNVSDKEAVVSGNFHKRMQTPKWLVVAAILVIAALGTYSLLFSHANTVCAVNANLTNSCNRPWLGATAGGYSNNGLRANIESHEQRIGRQVDVVHDYRNFGQNTLSADEKYFAARANTLLVVNWKPADPWANGTGNNATVNANIDAMANSIKSVAPHQVLLVVYHEPENNVSSGNCTTNAANAKSGSPADYVAMWHNVRKRFDNLGVSNVVWGMNYMGASKWNCLIKPLWPGNNYVNWVFYDPYIGGSQTYADAVGPFYNWMITNSDATNDFKSKPWGLNEWGAFATVTNGQSQVYQEYDDAKTALDNNKYPNIKMYNMFDTIGPDGDFRIDYTPSGAQDNTEQSHYAGLAKDARFTDGFYTPTTVTDTTKPSVTLTAPASGAALAGTVAVTGTASDNVGVKSINLLVDGNYINTDTTVPYSINLDTTKLTDGTHTVMLRAWDTSDNSGDSASVSVTVKNGDAVAPSAPTNLASPSKTATSVALSWSASTDNVGVKGYRIFRNGTQVADIATTSFTDNGVVALTPYSYTVKAYDATGNVSLASNALSVTTKAATDTTAPSVPSNVTAKATSPTQVALSWAASTDNVGGSGLAGYYVQRNGVTLAQVTTTSYTDSTVTAATAYQYTVLAYDKAGNVSAASTVASVTTPAPPDTIAPTAPASVTAAITTSQANLTWSASTDNVGVKGYNILRNGTKIATSTTTSFGDATVANNTSYTYTVSAFDAAGNTSAMSNGVTATIPDASRLSTAGLAATYFPNMTLSGTGTNRIDSAVNFNWGGTAPLSGFPAVGFSARWTGRVSIPTTGTYTFYTQSDDGVRLWVNDQLVVNNWQDHGSKENSATVSLTGGGQYNIKLEYYEDKGLANVSLLWSGPSISKAVIPNNRLTTASNGLLGDYFSGTSLGTRVLSRTDSNVNFDWASNAPDDQLPTDQFSVRWTGYVIVPATGVYTFYSDADDGVRLWVGGNQLIDDWTTHGVQEHSGQISLTAGTKVPVTMEYFEGQLLASAQLQWSGPGIAKAVIPENQLLDR